MNTPRTEAVVALAVGPMREYAIIEHAKNLERELIALQRRESILVDAMSEVKATSDGRSDQPIADIVAGCIAELSSANATSPSVDANE